MSLEQQIKELTTHNLKLTSNINIIKGDNYSLTAHNVELEAGLKTQDKRIGDNEKRIGLLADENLK